MRAPAGWDAASLVPGRAQWPRFSAAPLGQRWCRPRGSSVAKTAEVPRVAVVAWTVGILRGKGCWGPPVFLFCSWKTVLAEGILPGPWSNMFGTQSSGGAGFWDQVQVELQQWLGERAQVHLQLQWHWCLRYGCLQIS